MASNEYCKILKILESVNVWRSFLTDRQIFWNNFIVCDEMMNLSHLNF